MSGLDKEDVEQEKLRDSLKSEIEEKLEKSNQMK